MIRQINSRAVLETIIEKAPISRALLSKELGLTKATISSIVQELIQRNFVVEIGSGDASVGRKPTLLDFYADTAHCICLDLDIDKIRLFAANLLGEKLFEDEELFSNTLNNEVLYSIIHIIEKAKEKLPPSAYGIIGISIAIHGVVYNNDVVFTPYYNLSSLHLSEKISEHFHIPVYLENEANLAALGENIFSRRAEDIAVIGIHSGIGLGMVLNGKLYTGYRGFAGEFGHTIIELSGRQCPCGNKGCLEQYASERALLRDLADKKNLPQITFEQFTELCKKRDTDALDICEQFITFLAAGINNLLNLYNPQEILINSRFTQTFPDFLTEIKKRLSTQTAFAYSYHASENISLSTMNDDAVLYGAAYICIKRFLDIENFLPPLQKV